MVEIEFKVGQVVRLKSGGPDMVVVDETHSIGPEKERDLICKWWQTADECYHQDTFPHEALCLSDTQQD